MNLFLWYALNPTFVGVVHETKTSRRAKENPIRNPFMRCASQLFMAGRLFANG